MLGDCGCGEAIGRLHSYFIYSFFFLLLKDHYAQAMYIHCFLMKSRGKQMSVINMEGFAHECGRSTAMLYCRTLCSPQYQVKAGVCCLDGCLGGTFLCFIQHVQRATQQSLLHSRMVKILKQYLTLDFWSASIRLLKKQSALWAALLF